MTKSWKTKEMKELFKDILFIKDETECANFFRDLCTISELEEISKRWKAAKMLNKGETVREISKNTGLSTATVCRISHWMKHGEGGYQSMLKNFSDKK